MKPSGMREKAMVIPLPQSDDVSDCRLVERAIQGDRWAEEAIYLRYVGYVNALCLRLLRSKSDAQDAVQDTFVDVLEQLRSLRDPNKLRYWITGIAVHKAHRRFRRTRLASLFGLRNTHDDEACSLVARSALSPELCSEIARLDRALSRLSDDVRACWILRYVEGYALNEVAALCRCSLATTKRRIASAEEALRAHARFDEVHDE